MVNNDNYDNNGYNYNNYENNNIGDETDNNSDVINKQSGCFC